MDEKTKRAIAVTVIGGFGWANAVPGLECGRGDMCAVENPEVWHMQEREPAPPRIPAGMQNAPYSTARTLPSLPSFGTPGGSFTIKIPSA